MQHHINNQSRGYRPSSNRGLGAGSAEMMRPATTSGSSASLHSGSSRGSMGRQERRGAQLSLAG